MTNRILQLTNRRYERFCREYTVDHSYAKAYVRAGYCDNASNAKRLFDLLEVQIRIAQLEHEVFHKLDITNERILEEYAKIAFAEMVDVYVPGTMVFLPLDEMPDDVRGSIEQLEVCPLTNRIIKLKLSSKKGALDSLAKIHNMFESHQAAGSGEIHVHLLPGDDEL